MKLTRVTITGADDGVDQKELYGLSEEFPFVEWALLGSKTRRGAARYPSGHWMGVWLGSCPPGPRWAVHLCGELSERAMAGCRRARGWLLALSRYDCVYSTPRLQLNGFSQYRLPMLALADQMPNWEFVLQCDTLDAIDSATELRAKHGNITALWDCSGGRGVPMESWPLPNGKLPIGYAGGIDEHNIVALLQKLTANYEPDEFWVDMESGARTDDKFDLGKVRRVLELAKPFITGGQ